MIDDHHREIPLPLPVADLIDPDPLQPVEQIDVAARLISDPLKDPTDRPPRNTLKLSARSLRSAARQPHDLILKRTGEPCVVPCPRDRGDHHAMPTAANPRRICLQEAQRRPQIQRSPPSPTLTRVIAATPPPADPATIPLPPTRPDAHDHLPLAAQTHILNDRSLQTEQPGPYPDTAHAASPPRESDLRQPETLGSARRASPSSAGHRAHGNLRSAP
jgi:hypothetical protein